MLDSLFAQAQFAQMRPVAMAPSVAHRVPMYPPGGPGMGQQIFYGQGPPAMIPSQVILFLFLPTLQCGHLIFILWSFLVIRLCSSCCTHYRFELSSFVDFFISLDLGINNNLYPV